MLSLGSKSLFGLGLAALVAAFFYGAATEEASGIALLATVGIGALALGAAVVSAGPDRAPLIAADGPLGQQPPAGARPFFPSVWPLGAAVAVGLLAVGAATNGVVVVAGVVAAVIVVFGWVFQAWSEHPLFTVRFGQRLSDRLLVPLGLPVAVFVLVLVIALSLSRLLLAVPEQGSRIVALVVAVVILASAFFVANQERMARAAMSVLCAVALVAVGAAGVAGLVHGERHFERKGGVAVAAQVPISANGTTAFDVSALTFPAGDVVPLVFDNQTIGVPHNVGIYDAAGHELFAGQLVTGPATVTYQVPPLTPGSYVFHCDVHPNMHGTLTVTPAAPVGSPGAITSTTGQTATTSSPPTTQVVTAGFATTGTTAAP